MVLRFRKINLQSPEALNLQINVHMKKSPSQVMRQPLGIVIGERFYFKFVLCPTSKVIKVINP